MDKKNIVVSIGVMVGLFTGAVVMRQFNRQNALSNKHQTISQGRRIVTVGGKRLRTIFDGIAPTRIIPVTAPAQGRCPTGPSKFDRAVTRTVSTLRAVLGMTVVHAQGPCFGCDESLLPYDCTGDCQGQQYYINQDTGTDNCSGVYSIAECGQCFVDGVDSCYNPPPFCGC